MEEECLYLDDNDGYIYNLYADKVNALKAYEVSNDIEESRELDFLDSSRSPEYPDDVLVYLFKGGNKPEACWVRIESLAKPKIIGRLLNEPDQDFGCHVGDNIVFYGQQTGDKGIILWSDIKIKTDDLEDGAVLEKAIGYFNEERTVENLFSLMKILRDSYIWIPCNAVLSKEDEKRIQAIQEDKEASIGKEFISNDEIRLIPDILEYGDNFLFPVFSNVNAMGEYGEYFSKIEKHFLEAIRVAKNNDRKLAGIVINAYSEPFILDRELWGLVERLESQIQ